MKFSKVLFLFAVLLTAVCCRNRNSEDAQQAVAVEYSEKENLVDGKRQGQYLRYYPSGQIEMSCNYRDGKLDGPIVFYYESNGRISRTANFKNGIIEGDENSFYEDGNLKSTLVHSQDGAFVSVTAYYKSGMPYYEMKRLPGQKYLTTTFYYENGAVSEIAKSNKLIPVEDYVSYYEDGTIKKIGQYSNGELSGTWRFYDRDGNLQREINY